MPRREQCLVCDKPIFLAERFRVGDRFYHRRCLRCARCQTQLTLGNFYETETDGQFCCETCPDEEKQRQSMGDSDSDGEGEEAVRAEELEREKRLAAAAEEEKRISSLISNRLAMFERKSEEVLEDEERPNWRTCSLSDEQKSRRSMMHFLKSEDKDDPPPLPSQGPPPLAIVNVSVAEQESSPGEADEVEEEVKVLLRPETEKLGDNLVRESQSVSNIRDMFEKRGEKSTKPTVSKRTAIEECEWDQVKRSNSPKEGSTVNFYTPIPMPRGERRLLDRREKEGTQLEFKTPRKPSEEEEEWRDVNENAENVAEEAKSAVLGGDSDDVDDAGGEYDVFLSPKAVVLIEEDQDATEKDVKEEETEDREIVINLKEQQIVEIVKVPPTEESPSDTISSNEVRVEERESDKGRGEQEEESSATKESDPFIKEPSLELRRSDQEEEKEKVELCSTGESAGGPQQDNQCATVDVRVEEAEERRQKEELEVKVPASEREGDEEKYPLSLNPFGSDEEAADELQNQMEKSVDSGRRSYNPILNPFGEDEEEEVKTTEKKRISTNPFGSDDEETEEAPIKVVPMTTPRRTLFNQ